MARLPDRQSIPLILIILLQTKWHTAFSQPDPASVRDTSSIDATGVLPAYGKLEAPAGIYPPVYPWGPMWPDVPPFIPSNPSKPSLPSCSPLPPYPGVSSVQTLECDAESPQPEICGLSVISGDLQLAPGQILVVSYTNLRSPAAALSRLILSRERLSLTLMPNFQREPRMPFLASGFCPNQLALESCLHDAYHGVPPYRACQTHGCFATTLVVEPVDAVQPYDGQFWYGSMEGYGDTSLFAAQLTLLAAPEAGGSVLYFLASMSSHHAAVSYARSARLMYQPGSVVVAAPPANVSFANVSAPQPPPLPPPLPSPSLPAAGPHGDPSGISSGGNGSGSGSGGREEGNTTATQPVVVTPGIVSGSGGPGGDEAGSKQGPDATAHTTPDTAAQGPPPPPSLGGGAGASPGGGAGRAMPVRGGWWIVALLSIQYLTARALGAAAAATELA